MPEVSKRDKNQESREHLSRLIAHEVCNPLTNIDLAVEQLKNEQVLQAAKPQRLLEIIERNSQRINLTINNLLASFKPLELQVQLVEIHCLLEEALTSLKGDIAFNNLTIEKMFCESIVSMLDRETMKLVFINIINNVFDATYSSEGLLRIETKKERNYYKLYFTDNGDGISERIRNLVYAPFFSSYNRGMGLGLTSVRNIIKAHKGQIEICNGLEQGVTVEITLPLYINSS